MQKIIKQIKYRFATDVFNEFCQIIQPKIYKKLLFYKQLSKDGLLQPIPLYRTKLKSRGFNQAFLIGGFFNTILQLPVIDYFERAKNTKAQAELKEKKYRFRNTRGAFEQITGTNIKEKTIVVVDDVVTTGFTLLELTKTVKRGGAAKVLAITLARG